MPPAMPWIPVLGMALTGPGTPVTGLSVAQGIPAFRRLGRRIAVVSFKADARTVLGLGLIAPFLLNAPLA